MQGNKAIVSVCTSVALVGIGLLLYEAWNNPGLLWWQCSQQLPIWARQQAASCLTLSTPRQYELESERTQDGQVDGCGWKLPHLIGILQGTLLEGRKERKCCRHPLFQRKEHVSGTHSCHLCLVTGRHPLLVAHTPGAKGSGAAHTLKDSTGDGAGGTSQPLTGLMEKEGLKQVQ